MPKGGGRATWFAVDLRDRVSVESVSDEDAGAGFKAALTYFAEGVPAERNELSQGAYTVYRIMAEHVDEAKQKYADRVRDGQRGSERRWGRVNYFD